MASRASRGGAKSLLPTDKSMSCSPLAFAAVFARSMTRKAPGSGVRCDLVFMFGLLLECVCRHTQSKCGLLACAVEADRLWVGVALGGGAGAAAMFGVGGSNRGPGGTRA